MKVFASNREIPLTKQRWFKTQKSSQRQLDMVALSVFRTGPTAFNTAELFDATMICLDHPADFRVLQPLRIVHPQVVGCLVFNAVVCSGCPEYLDQSVSFKMNNIALFGNIDLPVVFQAGRPSPSE